MSSNNVQIMYETMKSLIKISALTPFTTVAIAEYGAVSSWVIHILTSSSYISTTRQV